MTPSRRRPLRVYLLAIAVTVAAGIAGFVLGSDPHRVVTTRAGLAYASSVQAYVQSRGVVYDIPSDVSWVDSGGVIHEGGLWPTCVPLYRRTPIVFGTVDFTLPGGAGTNAVVWVRC